VAVSRAVEELSGLQLLDGSDRDRLATLASLLTPLDEPAGTVLARQGEAADSFLLVVTGEAAVSLDDGDGPHRVGTIAPGSIVGELSVLRSSPRSATVVASRPLTGYVGDAHAFMALLDVPGVAERIQRTARQRLAANTRPVAITLRDAQLLVRPILPSDRGKLADTQPGFSRESHYRRFFSAPPLSEKVIRYLIDVDYCDHFAWVVLAADDAGEPGVASARYIRERDSHEIAEVAFSVVDEYQGRGLGTFLLGALGVAATENGVQRFRARVLAENEPMRAILRRAGAHFEFAEPGVLETLIDVPPFGAGLPGAAVAEALRDAARQIVVVADLALGAGS